MPLDSDVATLARLIAEPARAEMCLALLGGEALTAGELARIAGVAPSTAAEHLARLVAGGLLAVTPQGRHRYFRLADRQAGELLEYLCTLAPPRPVRSLGEDRRRHHLRAARTCYDHLAGALGVAFADSLVDQGVLVDDHGSLHPTPLTSEFFGERGVALPVAAGTRRPLVRSCLDWTERRRHLAGALGAALLDHLLSVGALSRRRETRAVAVGEAGASYLAGTWGVTVPTAV
jgi:DNA-binding transcriptional ArsR family regulator